MQDMLRNGLYSLLFLLGAAGYMGCGKKGGGSIAGPDPVEEIEPKLHSVVVNDGSYYTTSRNITVKIDYEDGHSAQLVGAGIASPTGFVDINPDSTIDGVVTPEQGYKEIGVRVQNEDGVTDTVWDEDGIILDDKPPQGIDSLESTINSDNNRIYFNLDLSDIASGTYSINGATTNSGDIADLDSVVYNEGTNYLKLTAKDILGNETTKDIEITNSMIKDEQKGLDQALEALSSLGYAPVSDSTQDIRFKDNDDNDVYLVADRMVKKNNMDRVFVIYDASGSVDASTKKAINFYNQTMESAKAPRRIIYIGPNFANEINADIGKEIGALEGAVAKR